MRKKVFVSMFTLIAVLALSPRPAGAVSCPSEECNPYATKWMATTWWWALRSQRNMALDEEVSNVMNLGSHNAFNAWHSGFEFFLYTGPSQIFSMYDQLRVGSRLLEVDIHNYLHNDCYSPDQGIALYFAHAGSSSFWEAWNGCQPWHVAADQTGALYLEQFIYAPENVNEVVILDIEDHASHVSDPGGMLLARPLEDRFADLVFTPADREALGRWPTRREMIAAGKQILVFDHIDNSFSPEMDPAAADISPYQRRWAGADAFWGADWNFPTDGGNFYNILNTTAGNGNMHDMSTDSFFANPDAEEVLHAEDRTRFLVVRGDCFPPDQGPHAFDCAWVQRAAEANVNVIKMDQVLAMHTDIIGHPMVDDHIAFPDELCPGSRGYRLANAVWSWHVDDPAVKRQWFTDLVPGDLTGQALHDHLVTVDDPSQPPAVVQLVLQMENEGEESRQNGRDYAIQSPNNARWTSVQNDQDRRYACMSARRVDDDGRSFRWAVTDSAGPFENGNQACRQLDLGDGIEYVFGGPVNGYQNKRLFEARQASPGAVGAEVWINVHDLDHDGNWLVNRAPWVGCDACFEITTFEEGTFLQPAGDELRYGDGSDLYMLSSPVDGDLYRDLDSLIYSYTIDCPSVGYSGTVTASESPFRNEGACELTIAVDDGHLGGVDSLTVPLDVVNVPPTDITLAPRDVAGDAVDGVVPAGVQAGTLSSVDPGPLDTHTYALVEGAYDEHNALFAVDGDRLLTAQSITCGGAVTYYIRVESHDGADGFQKPFELVIDCEAPQNPDGGTAADQDPDAGTSTDQGADEDNGGAPEEGCGCRHGGGAPSVPFMLLLLISGIVLALRRK